MAWCKVGISQVTCENSLRFIVGWHGLCCSVLGWLLAIEGLTVFCHLVWQERVRVPGRCDRIHDRCNSHRKKDGCYRS